MSTVSPSCGTELGVLIFVLGAITSTVKSWLYQDMLEKPQEMLIYKQVELGGLGVYHIKMRAMAMLIQTLLSQAISPCFSNNQYHKALYYWHVLDDRTIPDPGQPPYYSSEFFKIIRFVKENTPL